MGSFVLQTYSLQAMHLYYKKKKYCGKHVWYLCLTDFNTLLLPCLLFTKLSTSKTPLQVSRATQVQNLWTRGWGWGYLTPALREGPFIGGNSLRISEAPSVSLQAIPTSAVLFCQAEMKWDERALEPSKQQSLLAPTQLELGKRCLFLLSYIAFSVSFPISLWGRQSGGSRAAG